MSEDDIQVEGVDDVDDDTHPLRETVELRIRCERGGIGALLGMLNHGANFMSGLTRNEASVNVAEAVTEKAIEADSVLDEYKEEGGVIELPSSAIDEFFDVDVGTVSEAKEADPVCHEIVAEFEPPDVPTVVDGKVVMEFEASEDHTVIDEPGRYRLVKVDEVEDGEQ